MPLGNTDDRYGWLAVALHWIGALAVFGLFGLGLWMTGLDYYDPWYRQGPDLHRSIGVLTLILFVARLAWKLKNPKPTPLGTGWQKKVAIGVHHLLYLLVLLIGLSGYLISTADGRSISVFGWFEIPAVITSVENMEDLAGDIHYAFAIGLMALVGIHALATLKHHFLDRDATLLRMLGRSST